MYAEVEMTKVHFTPALQLGSKLRCWYLTQLNFIVFTPKHRLLKIAAGIFLSFHVSLFLSFLLYVLPSFLCFHVQTLFTISTFTLDDNAVLLLLWSIFPPSLYKYFYIE